MNIVFLVFGDTLIYHRQTYFAILTVLRHKRNHDSIIVYTDNPQYYNRLNEYVTVITLSPDVLSGWINGTGYIFRAKIKAIEDCANRNPQQHLLFMDGDTFLFDGLDGIDTLLNSGEGVMYIDEGHPSKMKGPSLRMWNAINGKHIDDCTVSMKHNVWNSGVIGISHANCTKVIELALKVCDEILASNVNCFTAEQYAFSIAMQQVSTINPATPWIGHYWGNKEQWGQLINNFLLSSYLSEQTVEQEIQSLDSSQILTTPLRIKKSNTRRRIVNILVKLFPDKIEK